MKSIQFFGILCVILVCFSCEEKQEEIDDEVIPPKNTTDTTVAPQRTFHAISIPQALVQQIIDEKDAVSFGAAYSFDQRFSHWSTDSVASHYTNKSNAGLYNLDNDPEQELIIHVVLITGYEDRNTIYVMDKIAGEWHLFDVIEAQLREGDVPGSPTFIADEKQQMISLQLADGWGDGGSHYKTHFFKMVKGVLKECLRITENLGWEDDYECSPDLTVQSSFEFVGGSTILVTYSYKLTADVGCITNSKSRKEVVLIEDQDLVQYVWSGVSETYIPDFKFTKLSDRKIASFTLGTDQFCTSFKTELMALKQTGNGRQKQLIEYVEKNNLWGWTK